MSVMVIACYRPKPGCEEALLTEVRGHLPVLRAQGLLGEGPSLCGRAADGTIVEVFCWASQAAIDQAHENPEVQKMWARFAEVCDYTTIADVAEASQLFSPFTPIDLNEENAHV